MAETIRRFLALSLNVPITEIADNEAWRENSARLMERYGK